MTDKCANPELQELLQKPNGRPVPEQRRLATIIPSQSSSKNKSRGTATSDVDPDDLVSHLIGDYGRWQFLMTFLLSLFSFPCTIHIFLPTFTAKESDYWCKLPKNLSTLPVENWINYSQPNDACHVRTLPDSITAMAILNGTAKKLTTFQKCLEWDYDRTEVGNTIISEWSLVCDHSSFTNLAEVVFLCGVGIGGVIGGWISDKFGRKKILMFASSFQSILAILSLLVTSYTQYVIIRFVMGLVSVSVVYAAFVLAVELVGGKWVTIAGVCIFFPLPMSYIIVSLVSMALPNWRDLQLALSIPGCLLILLWFVLPESPRWLIGIGKTQEAKMILQRAVKFNKRELPSDVDKLLLSSQTDGEHEKAGIIMLFKGPLLLRTVCLFFSWFMMTIAYYGLLLNIGNFSTGNIHITSIVLAVVEIPAIAISIPILLKGGRKLPIFLSMLICGLACVASVVSNITVTNHWVMIAFLTVGKFAIGSTNMMLPIFTAELYPVVVRNLGVGASQFSAGLALICIPYLWRLQALSPHLPMVSLAALSVIGGSIVLLLPETGRVSKNMPETKPTVDNFDGKLPADGNSWRKTS